MHQVIRRDIGVRLTDCDSPPRPGLELTRVVFFQQLFDPFDISGRDFSRSIHRPMFVDGEKQRAD